MRRRGYRECWIARSGPVWRRDCLRLPVVHQNGEDCITRCLLPHALIFVGAISTWESCRSGRSGVKGAVAGPYSDSPEFLAVSG
jgi:hypothetical protein